MCIVLTTTEGGRGRLRSGARFFFAIFWAERLGVDRPHVAPTLDELGACAFKLTKTGSGIGECMLFGKTTNYDVSITHTWKDLE